MHDFEVQIPVTSYYHAMNIINIISNYRQRSPTKKVGSNLWTIPQIYKRYWHRYDLGEKENNFFLLIQVIAKIVFMICKKYQCDILFVFIHENLKTLLDIIPNALEILELYETL